MPVYIWRDRTVHATTTNLHHKNYFLSRKVVFSNCTGGLVQSPKICRLENMSSRHRPHLVCRKHEFDIPGMRTVH